ncbi:MULTISPECIES: hemerythrin domain-containing protein [Streptomyces]|uniref:hemerythrin domain-containing protein n=1 Tax=Streptomyces TaxID=1883 RepID=UPI000CD544EE|nr:MULTISPECIES: hemerythrin domain-containing protein [Streptomyces]
MDTPLNSENGLKPLPRHFHGFALTHIAMRRDSRRLVAAAPLLTPAGYDAAARWWSELRAVIDWHHRTEDEILWPGMISHLPSFAASSHRMVQDHVELDHAMGEVSAALEGGAADALAHAAPYFDDVLTEHLRAEELISFPAFAQVPADVFVRIERRVLAAAPLRVKRFLPPWLLDDADQWGARDVGAMPVPVRALGRTLLRRRYRRLVDGIVRPL